MLGRAVIWFLGAYLTVNVVNTAITLVYTAVAGTTVPDSDFLYDPAYQATVPVHVVTNLLIWWIFGLIALSRATLDRRRQSLRLGVAWVVCAVTIDFLIYVVILGNTRWGLPADDYYMANQPWVTLSYLGIFLGPVLAGAFALNRSR
ncbi:hypothetical protein [Nocardia testacea]|uniref:hypothetical protein n=1 Tax=Nocardia testacea TaxID=248551 RepID=UPI0005850126|nr:hypothetical protein [Nocardia testacea]